MANNLVVDINDINHKIALVEDIWNALNEKHYILVLPPNAQGATPEHNLGPVSMARSAKDFALEAVHITNKNVAGRWAWRNLNTSKATVNYIMQNNFTWAPVVIATYEGDDPDVQVSVSTRIHRGAHDNLTITLSKKTTTSTWENKKFSINLLIIGV